MKKHSFAKILLVAIMVFSILSLTSCSDVYKTLDSVIPQSVQNLIPDSFKTMLKDLMKVPNGPSGGNTGDNTGDKVLTYSEYISAELDTEVIVEAYVQAHQSWYNNKITVYAQDRDGAYFLYDMACSEEDAAKLTPGTKIRVKGFKAEWSGEIEITDATFEFVEGADTYIAEPKDVTALLGTNDLIKNQNQLVSFKGMVVTKVEYKNGEPGDDIYVTLTKGGAEYSFCVERYLTDPDTEVYKAFADIEAGDVLDVEGFLYWYNGVNTHITAVEVKGNIDDKSEGVMTYEEYAAAELDSEVVIEAYVQATQSWYKETIKVYAQDGTGAYFLYDIACTEENAAKLIPGTKIKVTGYKDAWSGEVEVVDATFEFVNDGITYIAPAMNATELLGTDELIEHQNKFALFADMTVVSVEYKNGEPGDDIYVTVSKGGEEYSFCVERYLTDPDTEVYKAFADIEAGDVVDIEGFIYWYNGINTHITSVTVK